MILTALTLVAIGGGDLVRRFLARGAARIAAFALLIAAIVAVGIDPFVGDGIEPFGDCRAHQSRELRAECGHSGLARSSGDLAIFRFFVLAIDNALRVDFCDHSVQLLGQVGVPKRW